MRFHTSGQRSRKSVAARYGEGDRLPDHCIRDRKRIGLAQDLVADAPAEHERRVFGRDPADIRRQHAARHGFACNHDVAGDRRGCGIGHAQGQGDPYRVVICIIKYKLKSVLAVIKFGKRLGGKRQAAVRIQNRGNVLQSLDMGIVFRAFGDHDHNVLRRVFIEYVRSALRLRTQRGKRFDPRSQRFIGHKGYEHRFIVVLVGVVNVAFDHNGQVKVVGAQQAVQFHGQLPQLPGGDLPVERYDFKQSALNGIAAVKIQPSAARDIARVHYAAHHDRAAANTFLFHGNAEVRVPQRQLGAVVGFVAVRAAERKHGQ